MDRQIIYKQIMNTDKRPILLKRLGGILLALCLTAAMMPLAVSAETQDEEQASRWGRELYLLGRRIETSGVVSPEAVPHSGTITYDQSSKTLTLDGAVLDLDKYLMEGVENNYAAAVSASDRINIVLIGENRIISSNRQYGEDKEYVYGIKNSSGNINISGSGKLEISLTKEGSRRFTGMDCGRELYISECTVDIIMDGKGVTGIDTFGDFGIEGDAKVTVAANGEGSTAFDGTGMFDGSYVAGESELTMKADGTAFRCYLPSDSFKNDPPQVGMEKSGEGADEWDTETHLNTYKYVSFSGSRAGPPVRANKVYVLGRKIDRQYSDIPESIPHEGKIGYDPASNTLTLEDAALDVSDFDSGVPGGNLIAGIYSMSDLDLVLTGESTIFSSSEEYGADTEYVYGIDTWGRLNISGSGTLNIVLAGAEPEEGIYSAAPDGGNASVNIYGIGTDDSMSVDEAMINIDMGDHGKASGMYLWGPIGLTGGAVVEVTSKGAANYAVNGVNDIAKSTVSSDSVLEMTADGIAFNCWSAGEGLKKAGAMVNRAATPEGAGIWNKSTWLREYKYVRIPEYDPDDDILPPDDSNPGGGTDKASDRTEGRKAASDKKVKTGDQNNAEIWYSICLSAALMLALMTIVRLRRRPARRQKDI